MRTKTFVNVLTAVAALLLACFLVDPEGKKKVAEFACSFLVYLGITGLIIRLSCTSRRRRKQILVSICSLVAVLAIVHVLLPIAAPSFGLPSFRIVPSHIYHHTCPSSTDMYLGKYEGKQVIVKTNEDGLRSGYSRKEFRKHRVRIAALGDSFTFGLGVRQDSTWPRIMEQRLRTICPGSDIAVLNAGVMSYSPLLQGLQFKGIVGAYDPQLVILMLDATDIGDDWVYRCEIKLNVADNGLFGAPQDAPRSMPLGLLKICRPFLRGVGQAVVYPFAAIGRRFGLAEDPAVETEPYYYYDAEIHVGDTIETNRFFIYRHPLEKTARYFDFSMSNIVYLAGLCAEENADLLLVTLPRYHHWNANECPQNWEKGLYSLDEPYQYEYFRYFEEEGPDNGIDVFNPLPEFRSAQPPLVFAGDPHLNERGHDFLGGLMAGYVASNYADLFVAKPDGRRAHEPDRGE